MCEKCNRREREERERDHKHTSSILFFPLRPLTPAMDRCMFLCSGVSFKMTGLSVLVKDQYPDCNN